jgi:hypothetical protein
MTNCCLVIHSLESLHRTPTEIWNFLKAKKGFPLAKFDGSIHNSEIGAIILCDILNKKSVETQR